MIPNMSDHHLRTGSPHGPRWVWPAWWGLLLLLLAAFGLWIVRGVMRGVPGPVVVGVYVEGAVDSVVVVVTILATAALATVATVMLWRVPANRIGKILWSISAWMVGTFFVTMALYFLHSPTAPETAFANWLGTWSFVFFASTPLVLMFFPNGNLRSPRWRLLPWMAVLAAWVGLRRKLSVSVSGCRGSCPTHMPTANSKGSAGSSSSFSSPL
jgi:hypothetical protein